jgi:hypothetical protein
MTTSHHPKVQKLQLHLLGVNSDDKQSVLSPELVMVHAGRLLEWSKLL